jgi:PEP-utilising enzyme, PEP-binding domain
LYSNRLPVLGAAFSHIIKVHTNPKFMTRIDAPHEEEEGLRSTVPIAARKGRASYLGERSVGHPDGCNQRLRGGLWIDPSPDLLAELKEAKQLEHAQLEEVFEPSERPACTRDGIHVLVAANTGSAQEIANAQKYGAESIVLLRSEFLFRHFNHEPDEQEQLNAYRDALGTDNVLPINVRLLDVGGDKPVKFLWSQKETNPFLGCAGSEIAICKSRIFPRAFTRSFEARRCHGNQTPCPDGDGRV